MTVEITVWKTVYTCGEIDLSFSAGQHIDYEYEDETGEVETLDYHAIIDELDINDTLEEAFWEEMNGSAVESDVLEYLLRDHGIDRLREMEPEQLEAFVYDYVAEKLGTTKTSYSIDHKEIAYEEISEIIDSEVGDWDDLIYSEVASLAVDALYEILDSL